MSDDELSLEEIEALEKEPKKIRTSHQISRWPDEYKEELMIAILKEEDEIQLGGKLFTIQPRPNKSTYMIRPIQGFAPMAEVSEKWLMTS